MLTARINGNIVTEFSRNVLARSFFSPKFPEISPRVYGRERGLRRKLRDEKWRRFYGRKSVLENKAKSFTVKYLYGSTGAGK